MTKKNEIKKVLFYTSTLRFFRSTLIGHLYEIAQVYQVVLLSEKLDYETEQIIADKKLFPKLEKIIPVRQFSDKRNGLLAQNRYLYKLAKEIIQKEKPDVMIAGSDMHSFFELYLLRFAKAANALNITIQASNDIKSATGEKWVNLINAYSKFPSFLPLKFKLFFVNYRKYLGHFFYYWLLPLTVGEKPFFGKSSYILRRGNSGMRDTDYQIVFSERDFLIYSKDGVPGKKLYILSHPLSRKTREFFNKEYFNKLEKKKKNKKVFSIMLTPTEFGFKRSDYSPITELDREKCWVWIIQSVSRIFPDWEIYIKPHPGIKNIDKIKKSLEFISGNVKVANPKEPADKYVEMGDVIVGLPLSASTTLFTASLQCPKKPILSLDFHKELLGDIYNDFNGIEYINNKKIFLDILKLIRENKYRKKQMVHKVKPGLKEFSDSIEMIKCLYDKKNEIF